MLCVSHYHDATLVHEVDFCSPGVSTKEFLVVYWFKHVVLSLQWLLCCYGASLVPTLGTCTCHEHREGEGERERERQTDRKKERKKRWKGRKEEKKKEISVNILVCFIHSLLNTKVWYFINIEPCVDINASLGWNTKITILALLIIMQKDWTSLIR